MNKTILLFSLPIVTGLACVLYEQINSRSGLSIGQYMLLYSAIDVPIWLVWCIAKGQFPFHVSISALTLMLLYVMLSIAVVAIWWVSTRLSGMPATSSFEVAYPIFALLFSVLINHHRFDLKELAGIVAMVAGMIILSSR